MKKHFRTLFAASALLMSSSLYSIAIQPYASIENLPQTPYYVQDGYTFYSLISTNKSAVVIDVESQDGGVARFIAQEAANLPSVMQIYSVNIWQSPDISQKQIFQRFLSNVIQEMTTQMITPIRMSSLEASQSLNIAADFISVVGSNDSIRIYNDIMAWVPHLTTNGIICGNNWVYPSVQVGVTKAAASLNLTLNVNGNVWYFQKGM
jgi:hypothetical protein